MARASVEHRHSPRNFSHQNQPRTDHRLNLHFTYKDVQNDIDLKVAVQSSASRSIEDCTKDMLKLLFIEDINFNDVHLAGYTRAKGGYCQLARPDKRLALYEIGVTDGCSIHFEAAHNARPPTPCCLTIIGPNESKKINFTWFTAKTTLSMLLQFVLKEFSLEAIDCDRIHLLTAFTELDFRYMNWRLSQMDVYNNMSVHVEIIPPLPPATKRVQDKDIVVECSSEKETFQLRVSPTETIDDLLLRISRKCEGRRVLDLKLRNSAKEKLSVTDPKRDLRSLGVAVGQSLRCTFCLDSNEPQGKDGLTVIIKSPSHEPETTQWSVRDTFHRLMKYIDSHMRHRHLAVVDISSNNGNHIPLDADETRCLADLQLRPDDVITVVTRCKSPIRSSIVKYQPSPSPQLARSDSSTKQPVGLDNLGNSCYMNSAVQCLVHVPPFADFFLQSIDRSSAKKTTGSRFDDWNPFGHVGEVTGAYADLLWNLWRKEKIDSDEHSFAPSLIRERVATRDPRFGTSDQQDAQEFMCFLLDTMHEELKKANTAEASIVKQLFFGEMKSTVRCMACQREKVTKQPFSFLSVPLNRQDRSFWINFIGKNEQSKEFSIDVPMNGQVGHAVEIFANSQGNPKLFYHILAMLPDGEVEFHKPLNEIMTDELIFMEQEEDTRNRRPQPLDSAMKPATLTSCLEEFFSPELLEDGWTCQREGCKRTTTATKRLQLQTLPPVLIIQLKRFSHESGLHQKVQTLVNYPLEGWDLRQFLPRTSSDAVYDLVAVCNHTGSVFAGHYTSFARRTVANETFWYEFDDSNVKQLERDEWDSEIVSKRAYLLFYVKRQN